MTKLSFNRRPMPIFAEHRPLYKITQMLLVLSLSSRGGRSSIIKLQLFNWVLKNDDRKHILKDAASSGILNVRVWGLDPSLNIAIQFAVAEELIERSSNGVLITEKGKSYVKKLNDTSEFKEEYTYLSEVGKAITELMVSEISDAWG